MKTLADIQKDLRDTLPEGIDLVIQAIKNVLPNGTITLKVKADDLLDESPGRIRRLLLEYRAATANDIHQLRCT